MVTTTLPKNPARGNSARTDWTSDPSRLGDYPAHLTPVTDPNHDAVCTECNFWITVDADGVEYGHARATNRSSLVTPRVDCKHRPTESVDPRRSR